jgi:hypothetical protein
VNEIWVTNDKYPPSHNKQALINMLCEKLNEHDTRYKNAVDDADLLIAQTAENCALSSNSFCSTQMCYIFD